MKKLALAMAGMILLYSCNSETTVAGEHEDHDMAKMHEDNTRAVYHAVQTGDVSKIDSLFTEDVIDHNAAPDGSDIKGRDNVKAEIAKIHTYFETLKMDVVSQGTSADGNYHFAMVRMTGKAKENPWGMPVGMDMDDTMVDVMKIRDGKASEHWGFMSMGDISEMMKGMSGAGAPPKVDTTQKK